MPLRMKRRSLKNFERSLWWQSKFVLPTWPLAFFSFNLYTMIFDRLSILNSKQNERARLRPMKLLRSGRAHAHARASASRLAEWSRSSVAHLRLTLHTHRSLYIYRSPGGRTVAWTSRSSVSVGVKSHDGIASWSWKDGLEVDPGSRSHALRIRASQSCARTRKFARPSAHPPHIYIYISIYLFYLARLRKLYRVAPRPEKVLLLPLPLPLPQYGVRKGRKKMGEKRREGRGRPATPGLPEVVINKYVMQF